MKPFLFVTDFDGTMTKKDFYKIIIDDYIGEEGQKFMQDWRRERKVDVNFLNQIFSWHPMEEHEKEKLLAQVELDPGAEELLRYIAAKNGDFLVLSAGFDYYIQHVLMRKGLTGIAVISNPGFYEDGIFTMRPDVSSPYYSELFGIDKEKVILSRSQEYELICFAGDSEPDLKAALAAHVVFAKGELQGLLKQYDKEFYPVDSFLEIIPILEKILSP